MAAATDRDPTLALLHPKEKKRRAVANVQDYPLLVAEYWEKKTAVVVRVFDTKTSRYETLQTYGGHYRFLTETRLNEGRQDISKKGSYCASMAFQITRRSTVLKAQRI